MKLYKFLLFSLLLTTACVSQKQQSKMNTASTLKKINLAEEFSAIEPMQLKNLAKVNDHSINMIYLKGDYKMHRHLNGEKIFMVVEGILTIELMDGSKKEINKGEFVIIPNKLNHKPSSQEGVSLLFFEK